MPARAPAQGLLHLLWSSLPCGRGEALATPEPGGSRDVVEAPWKKQGQLGLEPGTVTATAPLRSQGQLRTRVMCSSRCNVGLVSTWGIPRCCTSASGSITHSPSLWSVVLLFKVWLFNLDHLHKNKSGSNCIWWGGGCEKLGLEESQAAGGSTLVMWLRWSQDHRAVSLLTPFHALSSPLCLGDSNLYSPSWRALGNKEDEDCKSPNVIIHWYNLWSPAAICRWLLNASIYWRLVDTEKWLCADLWFTLTRWQTVKHNKICLREMLSKLTCTSRPFPNIIWFPNSGLENVAEEPVNYSHCWSFIYCQVLTCKRLNY